MDLDIIKYYCIFLFTIYISMKLLNHKIRSFLLNIFMFIFALALTLITIISSDKLTPFCHLIPLLLLWIFMSIYTSRPQIAFIISILSFGINYSIHAFSSLISTIIVYIFCQNKTDFSFGAVSLFALLLHTLFSFILLQAKRLRNGLPLTHSTNYMNLSTVLCLLFITLPIYFPTKSDPLWQKTFFLIALPVTLAFLIYWWQAQITKAYKRNLELRELESLRTELQEKNATMMRVMEENERIRRINHRDNGLITALDYAVNDYLITEFTDDATAKARRDELLVEIERIRAGRVSSVNTTEIKATRYNTDISLLNILLNHISKRAIDEHVLFSVHIGTELNTYIPKSIEEEDFVHLLSDLLENAFVATRNVTSPMIQLQFYKWNKHLVLEIADNGIPFEINSIINMGICEMTTHADTGGSGIGLMDIWKTKETYGATYHIEEYDNPTPFTKKISLTFDGKNRYSIRTSRKDEILQMSKRADLQVYGYEE